ncbi:MAG: extracellular solute-binding protein [Saccharofermentans sp.]|nr:extracellular solute-binding protein [Saccharofermentans sp.]
MKVWRKLTAVLMTATILFGSLALTGCWKKKKGETISKDDPWYNVEKVNLSTPYSSKKDLEYFDARYLGKDGDNAVFLVSAQEKLPEDFDWEKGDFSAYYTQEVASFSASGEIVNSVNLTKLLNDDNEYLSDVAFVDGNIKLTISNYNMKTQKETYYAVDCSLKDGKMSDRVEVKDADSANEGNVEVGDISVGKNYYYDEKTEKSSYKLIINDKTDKPTTIDLGKEFKDKNIYNIDSILKTDESNALIVCSTEDGEMFLNLSLSDYSIKSTKKEDYEWLKDANMYDLTSLESGAYSIDRFAIKKLDFDKKELTEVFNFNDCNLGRSNTGSCQLLEMTDNKIIMLQSVYNYTPFGSSMDEYYLLTFTKAETNPHAGKVILDVLCLNGISKAVDSAVIEYNDTNKDYFIKYSTGYDAYENIEWTDGMSDDDWNKKIVQSQAEMSNKLAIDLMNGDGPDIIIGGFSYGQLNNDSYLLDLSSHMKDVGSAGYFSNVFDGAKVGGKLYQVPLSFYVQGIITDSKNVGKDQKGFTFEQYTKFVDEVCNGSDPIYGSQVVYLTQLADNMNDIFIDGNKANYNNDAFKALCKYVKDNVNEKVDEGGDIMVWDDDEYVPDPAQLGYISGIESYIGYLEQFSGAKNISILGMPSSDGRGVTIGVSDSVGVSATAVDEDACWQFIETLLGEEAQKLYANEYGFCVNIKAYESAGEKIVEAYNKSIDDGNYSYSGHDKATKVDKSIVTELESSLITNGHVLMSDPSINIIITEEIPAYLSGQKKIDDVISVIENRANTVLGER